FLAFCFLLILRSPRSTLFPYTTLFRSLQSLYFPIDFRLMFKESDGFFYSHVQHVCNRLAFKPHFQGLPVIALPFANLIGHMHVRDRKSTRLNSSHVKSSYAVFCLKKKT